jgi:superfamily I DNA/RNA helicase
VEHLQGRWRIEVVPLSKTLMAGSNALVNAEDGTLRYDETLGPAERIQYVAHELGHLVLHKRLSDRSLPVDPVLASVYGDAGAAAIARYSPRVREEAEATAFAAEWVCPADRVLEMWRGDPASTATNLATQLACTPNIVRVQLGNALYDLAVGLPATRQVPVREPTTEQATAAECVGKPVLVDAGPGTGKTATLISRIRFLVEKRGATPEQILVVTFSNEAAGEVLERVAAAVGAATANRMTISTFHGLGMELLHYHGGLLGFADDPALLDEDAQAELLSDLLGEFPCDFLLTPSDPWRTAVELVEHVNHCKHRLVSVDEVETQVEAWRTTGGTDAEVLRGGQFAGLFRAYERRKRERGAVDFADLIGLPLQLLEADASIRESYRTKYPWVLVDEFQDVSRATSRFLKALCGPANPPWVVGDARQSIYRFLGAAPENVLEFAADFPDAAEFHLAVNYRSAGPIVEAANHAAALMRPSTTPGWRPAGRESPAGAEPVLIAEAESQAAEYAGIVGQVEAWLGEPGVTAGDIAILTRRHVDVRKVVLGLATAGIRAQSAGLLTAEGAAGDLAAVLTAGDAPSASIPRLAFALGRRAFSTIELNAFVAATLDRERAGPSGAQPPAGTLADQLHRALEAARQDRFSADGWTSLATYLFDSSSYLRELLAAADTPDRAMALVEIASTLSLATAYRATHPGVEPRLARLGFAESLRFQLTKSLPLPFSPTPRGDAVRVMTCHASKGLEFPLVIVANQSVPQFPDKYPWLPRALRPATNEDTEQADAVAFVGLTRAKRAAVLSFASRATARGRPRTPTQILARLRSSGAIPNVSWTHSAEPLDQARAGLVWGGVRPPSIKPYAISGDACPIRTYLETHCAIRFPAAERDLYPTAFHAIRSTCRRIVRRVNAERRQLDEAEVLAILTEEWPTDRVEDHPHRDLYNRMASDSVRRFAKAYAPGSVRATELDLTVTLSEDSLSVSLDVIALYREGDACAVAIAFRPESFLGKAEGGSLPWGKFDQSKRTGLVAANLATGGIEARIFSAADGVIYEYRLNPRFLAKQESEITGRLHAMSRDDFSTEISDAECDRCPARVSCPHWIGALDTP